MNAIRTLLAGFAIVPILAMLLGCNFNEVTGSADCSASWIGPQWSGVAAGGLVFLALVLKGLGGTGTVKQNLLNPSVPVTEDGKEGTVTPASVAVPGR